MNWRPYAIGGGAGLLLGLLVGWFLWAPSAPIAEQPALEKPLPSGGIAVQRDPDRPVPPATRTAAREAGGKLERSVSVTVQPRAGFVSNFTPTSEGEKINMPCSCGPVTIDLGLIRMPDRTRRVVATSPDGEIVGGLDIPLDLSVPARALHWAAGATYTPTLGEYGAFVDRDLGPFRLGVELQQRREGLTAVVRAGLRF